MLISSHHHNVDRIAVNVVPKDHRQDWMTFTLEFGTNQTGVSMSLAELQRLAYEVNAALAEYADEQQPTAITEPIDATVTAWPVPA